MVTNWRVAGSAGAQRSTSQLLRIRPALAHKIRQPCPAEEGRQRWSAAPAQQPGCSRLGLPCRGQPGPDGRIQRENLQERCVKVLHSNEAAGFGHAAELAYGAGKLRLRQVLGDVGAPHAVKSRGGTRLWRGQTPPASG